MASSNSQNSNTCKLSSRSNWLIREFVLENPRPYDVVTLFTVPQGCEECWSVYYEMTGAQYSFKQANSDTFFGVLYYSQEHNIRNIFLNHGIKTVPYLCTSKQEKKRQIDQPFYRAEDLWFIKSGDAHDTQELDSELCALRDCFT